MVKITLPGATIEPYWTYRSQQSTSEPQQPHQSSEFFYWNWMSSSTCKTCQKIESGAFVDMVELLPERLDTADSEDAKLKKKKVALHTGMASMLCRLCHCGGQKTTCLLS